MIPELPFEKLCRKCDLAIMGSSNSSQISTLKTIIGQERAVKALRFGLGIKEKGFNIWPVKSIDEGIEILTGVRAGERQPGGGFEENTVNGLVDQRLQDLAEKLVSFGKKEDQENNQ